ncbi:MAG TPA: CpsD/CapB family tyrosine-protein kinase [Acidimicrobiia bacterium]|jgi:capsular exopolysaccharide synthesis family protein
MSRTLPRRGRAAVMPPDLLAANEAFRIVRSNLSVAMRDLEQRVVVVTSALPREGKTSTSVSLAQSFALAGSRVALVDLDLREPDSHRLLQAHNEIGVSDVLLDHRAIEDCIQHIEIGAERELDAVPMQFLAAGPRVTNPAELLSTTQAAQLLEDLAFDADVVVIDAPPVLSVADTLLIGRYAAGAVLVVEAGRTPAPTVRRAKDALTRNQTRLLGVVLNRFRPKRADVDDGDPRYGSGHG